MYTDEESGLIALQRDDNDIAIDLKDKAGPNSVEGREEKSGGYGDDMIGLEFQKPDEIGTETHEF